MELLKLFTLPSQRCSIISLRADDPVAVKQKVFQKCTFFSGESQRCAIYTGFSCACVKGNAAASQTNVLLNKHFCGGCEACGLRASSSSKMKMAFGVVIRCAPSSVPLPFPESVTLAESMRTGDIGIVGTGTDAGFPGPSITRQIQIPEESGTLCSGIHHSSPSSPSNAGSLFSYPSCECPSAMERQSCSSSSI